METNILEDLEEFLEKVEGWKGEEIQSSRIFTSFQINSLWGILMGEAFNKVDLEHLVHILGEK